MQYSEIMIRYGELSTKGKNRMRFINKLRNNISDVLSISSLARRLHLF